MIANSSAEDEDPFESETAGVRDPEAAPALEGEVIPPEQEQEAETPLDAFITEELVGELMALPGEIMARKTGHDYWRPDETKKRLLGKGCQPLAVYLVRKYLAESAGPYVAAGAVIGAVYFPAAMEELASIREAKHAKETQRERQSPQSSQEPTQDPMSSAASLESEDAENHLNSEDWQNPFDES